MTDQPTTPCPTPALRRERRRYPDGCHLAEDAARDAADAAVREVFAILGVDVNDPAAVEEFRRGLRVGQTLQRAADKGLLVAVGVITAALMGAFWLGLVEKIRRAW